MFPAGIYFFKVNNGTWKHCVNLFKIENKDTRKTSITLLCCLHCQFWTDFTDYFVVSIFEFKRVNDSCIYCFSRKSYWHLIWRQVVVENYKMISDECMQHSDKWLLPYFTDHAFHDKHTGIKYLWKVLKC